MRLSTLYLGFWMVSVVLVYFEWVSIIGFVSCSFVLMVVFLLMALEGVQKAIVDGRPKDVAIITKIESKQKDEVA